MMDDESRENLSGDAGEEDKRTAWQRNKEELYDKVPLTLRQLDVIIVLGIGCWIYKKYNTRFLYYV